MKNKLFFSFLIIIAFSVIGILIGLKSPIFSTVAKNLITRYTPQHFWIQPDFEKVEIRFFPPGLVFKNFQLQMKKENPIQLPRGTSLNLQEISIEFGLFQLLSGSMIAKQLYLKNGALQLFPPENLASARAKPMNLGDFKIALTPHSEVVVLENMKISYFQPTEDPPVSLLVKHFRMTNESPRSGTSGSAISFQVYFNDIELGNFAPQGVPPHISTIRSVFKLSHQKILFDYLFIQLNQITLASKGEILGDLLHLKEYKAQATLEVNGPLAELSPHLTSLLNLRNLELEGQLEFKAQIAGEMKKMKMAAKTMVKDLRFLGWNAESFQSESILEGNLLSGELHLKSEKIVITESPKSRMGQTEVASGGKVEIEPFLIRFPLTESIPVQAKLTRAHLHWLIGQEAKKVFSLLFKASGTIGATFPARFSDPWIIPMNLALEIEEFQLDNQKWGVSRPLKRVLSMPSLKLTGSLELSKEGLVPKPILVELPDTQLQVGGGIYFNKGLQLTGSGLVNLKNLGHIAEIPIRGAGKLDFFAHGLFSDFTIDFDLDLKEAQYINLLFGDLKGRVSWEDNPDKLVLSNLQGTQSQTKYVGNGSLVLRKESIADLDVNIERGEIKDFFKIFEILTEKLDWLPRSLTGSTSGKVKITDGLGLDELHIIADMKGTDWKFFGERFDTVSFTGGYDQGTYFLHHMQAQKKTGKFYGNISFDPHQNLDWQLRSDGLTLMDFQHLSAIDVPVRGKIFLTSSGNGPPGKINALTTITLKDLILRGISKPQSDLVLKSTPSQFTLKGSLFQGQGIFESNYSPLENIENRFRVSLMGLDFTPFLYLLNPELMPDISTVGKISGEATFRFYPNKTDLFSGQFDLTDYQLAKSGTHFSLEKPVSVKVERGSFKLKDLIIKGNNKQCEINITGEAGHIEGSWSGPIDLSILEFFTPAIAKAKGAVYLDFLLGGMVHSPTFFGKANVTNGTVWISGFDAPFENLSSTIQLRQNVISFLDSEGDLAGGRVTGGGAITLFPNKYPQLDLFGILSGSRIKAYPFHYLKAKGDLRISGEAPPYLIEGIIKADSGLIKEKVLKQKQAAGSFKSLHYIPPTSQARTSDIPTFKLKIQLSAEKGILVQNDLFNLELKGQMTLINTLDTPRVLGIAESLGGTLQFKDRVFQIQSASAKFSNPALIDPQVSLIGTTEVGSTKIQLFAIGKIENLKIELTSNPVMPEPEILSLLALGLTSSEIKRLNAADRSLFDQGEAFSLLLHSLDFNREVESKTGLQIQLNESIGPQQGASVFRPQNQTETSAAPRITIKKKLTKKVDLSYGSTVGLGSNNQQQVNAEVKVTPNISILGVWDYYQIPDTQSRSSSYGMDLKLQKRFK